MNIIPKIYIANGRAYKTKKYRSIEVDCLIPFEGISIGITTMYNEGDSIVLEYNGFNIPVNRQQFLAFMSTVDIIKGIVVQPCAIVSLSSGFGILNAESQEYIDLFGMYESLNADKGSKFLIKDLKVGDIVEIIRGKSRKESDLVYLGEFYVLPFSHHYDYVSATDYIRDFYFQDTVVKRFVFATYSESKLFSKLYFFSSFPIVSNKIGEDKTFTGTKNIINSLDLALQSSLLGHISSLDNRAIFKDTSIFYHYIKDLFLGRNNIAFIKVFNTEPSVDFAKKEQMELLDLKNVSVHL